MRNSIRALLAIAVVAASTITLQAASGPNSAGQRNSGVSSLEIGCSSPALPRLIAEVNPAVLIPLRGNVHPLAQPQYDRGRVSDSLALQHMLLVLQRSPEQERELAARIQQMHDPASPNFHQWLQAEDIGRCYGVADSDIAKVSDWLQSQGFQVDSVPAGKMTIIFSGTAGQVRSAFKTEIHNLNVRGEQHIANMSEPQVPAALAPVIAGMRSLNNFFPKPLVRNVTPIQRDSKSGKWRMMDTGHSVGRRGVKSEHSGIGPLITFGDGFGDTYWAVGPQDFYTIYNETPLLTSSAPINGAGQTLAIVQDSDVDRADVTSFRSQFGLPAYPSTPNNTQGGINYFNGIPGTCSDPGITDVGETEADIDLQWIGATAPAAIIDFVSCADTDTTFGGDLSALYIVNNLERTVSAFSESFGECEAQLGSSSNAFYNQLWQQAAAEGQTVVVASGDSGDDTCDQGSGGGPNGGGIGVSGLSVNGLASTPYNVAAGGTDFSDTYQTDFEPVNYWNSNDQPPYGSALSYVPEITWNDTCASTVLVDFLRYNGITYTNGPEGLCNDANSIYGPYPFTYLDGTGGGISGLYGRPSWQSVYGVGLGSNYTSTHNRNMPDVSLFAGDGFWAHLLMFCESDFGFPCDYTNNNADYFALSAGGTSFTAPQLAGILGLINQATSSRQGQANYMFYSLAALEYGSPGAPNTSTTVPSLYTCEGSNINAISASLGIFGNCLFYNVNRTSQVGSSSCLNGNNTGCLVDNNDQPCQTGTANCFTGTQNDMYGLLSVSNSSLEAAFPQSAGYSAAAGLGSVNVANLVLNWTAMQGDDMLVVSANGSGSVTSGDGYIDCPGACTHAYIPNQLVTLSATPASGWTFTGWSGACSGTGYCNLTVSANLTLTANFTNIGSGYTLSVTVAGSGTVRSSDGQINCPGTCSYAYQVGAGVTLNASSGSGSSFGGWIGPCTGTSSCNLTMTQNYSVTGDFTSAVEFVATTPCRLVDTRGNNVPIRGGTFQNFAIPNLGGCNIPNSATAYSLNVTVVPTRPLGYLTIWPTGQDQPLVSTLNSPDARTKANAAIVPAGYQGAVSVFVTDTTQLILDIDGYFAPANQQSLQFYPEPPCRVVDTRAGSLLTGGLGPPSFGNMETRPLPILSSTCFETLSITPAAYSFNATVVPHPAGQRLGYLTLWPDGQNMPLVSTLNNPTATVVANGAIVPAGNSGKIDAFTYNSTDLIIDSNGFFSSQGVGYALYPVAPCRVYDSRDNNGQPIDGQVTINVAASPCTPPANAAAYVFNATVVPPHSLGYLTLWPAGEDQPIVSTLNAYDGRITSNLAIVPNGGGSIDAFVSNPTHLILDISGYFAPQSGDSPAGGR